MRLSRASALSVPKNASRACTSAPEAERSATSRLSAGASALALGELRRLAGLVQAGFLALDDPRVARQEARPLQRHAQLRVGLDERPRDAVADGTRLAARPAAVHAHAEVKRPFRPC